MEEEPDTLRGDAWCHWITFWDNMTTGKLLIAPCAVELLSSTYIHMDSTANFTASHTNVGEKPLEHLRESLSRTRLVVGYHSGSTVMDHNLCYTCPDPNLPKKAVMLTLEMKVKCLDSHSYIYHPKGLFGGVFTFSVSKNLNWGCNTLSFFFEKSVRNLLMTEYDNYNLSCFN